MIFYCFLVLSKPGNFSFLDTLALRQVLRPLLLLHLLPLVLVFDPVLPTLLRNLLLPVKLLDRLLEQAGVVLNLHPRRPVQSGLPGGALFNRFGLF